MIDPNDDILEAIANIKRKIAEITANPKPDYSVGNRSISWNAYFSSLTDQLAKLLKTAQDIDGPWEINQKVATGW